MLAFVESQTPCEEGGGEQGDLQEDGRVAEGPIHLANRAFLFVNQPE